MNCVTSLCPNPRCLHLTCQRYAFGSLFSTMLPWRQWPNPCVRRTLVPQTPDILSSPACLTAFCCTMHSHRRQTTNRPPTFNRMIMPYISTKIKHVFGQYHKIWRSFSDVYARNCVCRPIRCPARPGCATRKSLYCRTLQKPPTSRTHGLSPRSARALPARILLSLSCGRFNFSSRASVPA